MNKDTLTNEYSKIDAGAGSLTEPENPFEEWSSAGIGNAFLFGKVMTANPDLLLELLQYSLPEYHIQKIVEDRREVDIKLSIDSHGVRLDVLTSDDKGRHIDVEMQMRNEKNIPHRMRYYEGSIDQTILEKGSNYSKLGDLVILFITPFDPFDASGLYKYTFRNTCQEDMRLILNDGVSKIVLNASGHKGDISPDLKEFLQLVIGNTDTSRYSKGSFAERVQNQVKIARRNAKWRKEYMDWEMTLLNEQEKGREQERAKTEEQRKRADAAEKRADAAEKRADAAREQADAAREQADAAREQADAAREQADAAKERADAAEERADAAEAEIRRLKSLLEKLGNSK